MRLIIARLDVLVDEVTTNVLDNLTSKSRQHHKLSEDHKSVVTVVSWAVHSPLDRVTSILVLQFISRTHNNGMWR